jgi:hypothetical protein
MPMDYVNEILEKSRTLDACIEQLRDYGMKLSSAEKDYKITLRQEALKLRAEENMPVTLINQIIYGVPGVADKRFKRDIAETLYNTCQEKINTLKLQIRILESQINREWNQRS